MNKNAAYRLLDINTKFVGVAITKTQTKGIFVCVL